MENKHTSLELSKKLREAGCELESEKSWYCSCLGHEWIDDTNPPANQWNTQEVRALYPAYDILNDICCRYADKFFGKHKVNEYGDKVRKLTPTELSNLSKEGNTRLYYKAGSRVYGKQEALWEFTEAYLYHSKEILVLLQQGKKEEAEKYIWEHCLFNPRNKEKK